MLSRVKTPRVALALVLLGVAGCTPTNNNPGGQPGSADALRELATILPLYSGEHKHGPGKPSDLAPYEAGAPLGYQAVVAGDVVVVWGATMPGEGEGGGTEAIVAYEKKSPTEGGAVLLQNGQVREMTADQFQAAPKAK
jgi:hypothetical protein